MGKSFWSVCVYVHIILLLICHNDIILLWGCHMISDEKEEYDLGAGGGGGGGGESKDFNENHMEGGESYN